MKSACVGVLSIIDQYICYQNTHTLQSPQIHTPTHYKTIWNNHSTS